MQGVATFNFTRQDTQPPANVAIAALVQATAESIAAAGGLETEWNEDRDFNDLEVHVHYEDAVAFAERLTAAGIHPDLCGTIYCDDELTVESLEMLGFSVAEEG